jgi:hypothetical protein
MFWPSIQALGRSSAGSRFATALAGTSRLTADLGAEQLKIA